MTEYVEDLSQSAEVKAQVKMRRGYVVAIEDTDVKATFPSLNVESGTNATEKIRGTQ